jgi:hypothetical protein
MHSLIFTKQAYLTVGIAEQSIVNVSLSSSGQHHVQKRQRSGELSESGGLV